MRHRGKRADSTRFRPSLEELETRIVPSFADGGGAVITQLAIQNNGTQLVLTFDGPLSANPINPVQSPTNAANYSLQVPSGNPEVVTSSASSVSITSATYNSSNFQVTLNLGTALVQGSFYRVFVNGTANSDGTAQPGLIDGNGNPIDGDYDDTASGNFYALFAWTTAGTPLQYVDSGGDQVELTVAGPGQLEAWRALDGDFVATNLATQAGLAVGAIQQLTVANGVLGQTTLSGSATFAAGNSVVVVPSIAGQRLSFTNALPPYFQLTAPPLPTPPTPVVATASNLPYSIQIQQVSSTLPAVQSPVDAQDNVAGSPFNGYWLMFGGRTNGLHNFDPTNDFPPQEQNENIFVVNPITWQTWTINWSATDVPAATAYPLYSTNQQSFQQGDTLFTVGGYGAPDLGGGNFGPYTTYDTLTALSVDGLIKAVVNGAWVAELSQIQQIQDPRLQVTGGEMQLLGNQAFLVVGQDFQGQYFSPTATQTYTDEIQSFQINYNGLVPASLGIANYQAQNDQVNFRRRDYDLGNIIQSGMQPGLEIFGGVFTPGASTDPNGGQGYRTPIVVSGLGATQVGQYQQFFNQYSAPNIGLFNATTQSMFTVFLGGISLYDYSFATGQLTADAELPFVDDVTTLMQGANGVSQEFEMPSQLPGLYGAEARFFAAPGLPQYANGVIALDQLNQATTLGYMFGGILSTVPNTTDPGTQTSATDALFRVVLVPAPRSPTVTPPLAPTITITHGSNAAIGLQSLDPTPSGQVNYNVTILDPLLNLKTQDGLTLQDGYFNYRGEDEKYLLSNNGSNAAGGGWFVLMPNGKLYAYVPDANNDLNATLAAAPTAVLTPSVWYNPSLLTTNTGVPIATSGINALYDLKIELGLDNPALAYDYRGADEWYFLSTNRSNPAGGGWYMLMPDNKLYAWRGNLEDGVLVADFNAAPYSADVYASTTLLTGATLPTSAAITFGTSSNNGGTLTLDPIPGFDRTASVTVTATDNAGSNSQTFTFTVNDVAPLIAPVSDVVVNHNAFVPTIPLTVTDPDPDAALRSFFVGVSSYNPLYDLQAQLGLNAPAIAAAFNYRLQDERYFLSSNGSNPAGYGYYVLMPDNKLYAYVQDAGNDLAATVQNAPVANFTVAPYLGLGNVYLAPALLTGASAPTVPTVASNRGPLYDIQTELGLNSPDIAPAFNYRSQNEKYLLSANGSNPTGQNYYVLMPTDKLYAYVPDAANDLTSTLANAPIVDFTLVQYAGVGNVYANPRLLYAAAPATAFIADPLFNLKQQDGLYTADIAAAFNFRGQSEKYFLSGNGSNPAGFGYYVLMPNQSLYAYVPDPNNDLTATQANAPVADFTQAPYAAFLNGGNVFSTPSLLYSSTGQIAAVTATVGPSGVVTLTANAAFAGTVRITVTVSDGAESGKQSFLFSVNDQAPTITPLTTSPVTASAGMSTTVNFIPGTFNGATALQAASIDNPLFDINRQFGLNTADIASDFNYRHQNEKYLLSGNGSNPAGFGYYVLMPDDKLYAYVPDMADDLVATLSQSPAADFSQAPYIAYGNVYSMPALLYNAASPPTTITTSFPSLGSLLLSWPSGYAGTFTLTILVGDGALETQQQWFVSVS